MKFIRISTLAIMLAAATFFACSQQGGDEQGTAGNTGTQENQRGQAAQGADQESQSRGYYGDEKNQEGMGQQNQQGADQQQPQGLGEPRQEQQNQ